MDDEDNIIKKTLYLVEDRKFNKIVPENEICFDCLIKMPKHMDHCEVCNNCVEGFQMHNKILNRCVGDGNLRIYFWWCFSSFIALQMLMLRVFTLFWDELETPFWL